MASHLGREIAAGLAGALGSAETWEPIETGLSDWMSALEDEAGGKAAAARAVGVHPSTWRRWAAGTYHPSASSAGLLTGAVRGLGADRDALQGLGPTVGIEYRNEPRSRDVGESSLMWDHEATDRLVDAYLDGADDDELAGIFLEGVGDEWYRDALEAGDYDDDLAGEEGGDSETDSGAVTVSGGGISFG